MIVEFGNYGLVLVFVLLIFLVILLFVGVEKGNVKLMVLGCLFIWVMFLVLLFLFGLLFYLFVVNDFSV